MASPEEMLDALHQLYQSRVNFFQKEYNRILPLPDMVVNRWEKATLCGFGEQTSIYDSALVLGDVTVGEHTWIGPHVILDGAGAPLRIGNYCSISAGVQVYTHDSVKWAVTGGKAGYEYAPTTIGSHVYLGPHTIVAKGMNIGSHVIIGAHSFVNKELPDFSVAWGQPVKIVGTIIINDDGLDYSIQYL